MAIKVPNVLLDTHCRAMQREEGGRTAQFVHSLEDLFHPLYSEKAGGTT